MNVRLARLKKQVDDGTYKVDAGAVADAMLAWAEEHYNDEKSVCHVSKAQRTRLQLLCKAGYTVKEIMQIEHCSGDTVRTYGKLFA